MNSLEEASFFDVICLWGFSEREVEALKEKTLVFFTPQLMLDLFVYYDGVNCDLEQFQTICKEQVFRSFAYVINPTLPDIEQEKARAWLLKAQIIEWQVQLAASDYQDFGLKVFENLCTMGKRPFDGKSFYSLKDLFKNIPAVICGAGPSLKREVSFLKRMEDRGLIFAGGAALGALGNLGVAFHIAAGIDPDPHYDKVLMQNEFEAPFFYQSRFASYLLQTVQGPSFQVPSNSGYALEEFFEEGKSFDGGWTVSTFCAALAVHFGCDPIIFVGVDLSYDSINIEQKAVTFEDPLQGSIKTQKDWVLAAKWLEALTYANKDFHFYKTVEEGLSIEGIKKIPFNEQLFRQIDTKGLVHVLKSFWDPLNSYEDKLTLLKISLDRSLSYVDVLLKLFEMNYPLDPTDKGEFVLNLLDLEEQVVYQKILEPIWDVWQFPLYRKCEDLYARRVNRILFFKKVLEEYRVRICN